MSTRHRWVKLRIHVRICKKCGMGKVNAQRNVDRRMQWFTTYHRPDGVSAEATETPPCVVGPLTEKFLAKYAAELDAAPVLAVNKYLTSGKESSNVEGESGGNAMVLQDRIPSKTTEGADYHVTYDTETEVGTCECRGFKFRRECSHTRELAARPVQQLQAALPALDLAKAEQEQRRMWLRLGDEPSALVHIIGFQRTDDALYGTTRVLLSGKVVEVETLPSMLPVIEAAPDLFAGRQLLIQYSRMENGVPRAAQWVSLEDAQ